jgi:hypothetical protein
MYEKAAFLAAFSIWAGFARGRVVLAASALNSRFPDGMTDRKARARTGLALAASHPRRKSSGKDGHLAATE